VYGRTVLSQNYTKIGLKYQFFGSRLCNMAVSCKSYVVLVRNGWVNECVTGGMIPSWDSHSTLRKTFHCHLVQHIPHGHWGWTWTSVVKGWWLTTWAMAQPVLNVLNYERYFLLSCSQLTDVFLLQLDNPLSAWCVVYLWFLFIYL